ncbi:MAG: hypothetical protein V8R08_03880 [Coriobacteriales bacterium]
MPRLEFSNRFADDLAAIETKKLEQRILNIVDSIELFGGFGSSQVPVSITEEFGDGVRFVAVNPFDLIYTWYPEKDLVHIEALIHQRSAR